MSEAAVDLEFLRRQLREAGIEEALGKIVGTFLETAPERAADLQRCLASGPPEAVVQAAHALKSGAAVVGATDLTALLQRIEDAGRAGTLSDRGGLAEQVRAAAEAAYAELRLAR